MIFFQGKSPYQRDTYTYTPIVAALLTPNEYLSIFGKIVFCSCDIIVGYLIYKICQLQGHSARKCIICAQLWLLNPLTLTVSSRGNAESLIALLVLSSLYFLMKKNSVHSALVGGMVYGLSVHMKIYPITYSLPIFLYLSDSKNINRGYIAKLFSILSPNRNQMMLVITSVAVFLSLTSIFYYW